MTTTSRTIARAAWMASETSEDLSPPRDTYRLFILVKQGRVRRGERGD